VGGYFFIHRKTIFPLLDKKNPRIGVRGSRYHRGEELLWEDGAYYTPKEKSYTEW